MSYGGGGYNNYNQGYGGGQEQRPVGNVDYHAPSNANQNNNMYSYEYADSQVNLAQPATQPYSSQFAGAGSGGAAGTTSSKAAAHWAANEKKGTSKWIKIGIPVLLLVIGGGVAAGVLISKNKDDGDDTASSSGSNAGSKPGSNSSAPSSGSPSGSGTSAGNGMFFSSVDSYFQPVYPETDNPTLFAAPSFAASSSGGAWPADTFKPASPSVTGVRPDRPRLIAPKYKWDALPDLIKSDPYLKKFDEQILANASAYHDLPRVRFVMDGGSGILDVSREKKMRIKAYAYAYRRTGDTKWVDSAWKELDHAMGTAADSDWDLQPPDLWYMKHYLDLAEMTAAFAIAYDWMYDGWDTARRDRIREAIINHGLNFAFDRSIWWNGTSITGNWNCVCNSGLTFGALAILGDDTSGLAERVLQTTVANAKTACVNAPTSDGTWAESPNYWYFGTTGHAELSSVLTSATGSDHGLLNQNTNFKLTALFHMYVTGMTSLFDYADHGPNKFSTTANSLIWYGAAYKEPRYMLFQRDRFDAQEPWSIFWYDPTVRGAWWNGLPLDHYFNDPKTQWVSMRSSWTTNKGTYLAMKSSQLMAYQAHGDLDCGDFVFDAMGERWFGELGSGDYLSAQYFNSEADDAVRWTYYRKTTQGQNTLVLGLENQLPEAKPTMKFETTGEVQGSSPNMELKTGSTAYAVTDMSSAYPGSSVKRGVRFVNNRKAILVQDELNSNGKDILWRAHTNATITPGSGGTAVLELHGKKLTATILSPQGASFTSVPAARLAGTELAPAVDQENPGVSVLTIALAAPAGAQTISVLLVPQWDGGAQLDSPSVVALDSWSLTSHP